MFGNKGRKAIRDLNRVSWDHALRIEMLELKIKSLLITQEQPKLRIGNPPPNLGAALLSGRFSNIDERGRPRCGLWSPELGPCIRDWPHKHEEVSDGN